MKIYYLGIATAFLIILVSIKANDLDFDVFENFTASSSSLMMDSESLVKEGDASGDASSPAAASVHTEGQDYDDCNAEFEYCNEESAILENKIYNVSEK